MLPVPPPVLTGVRISHHELRALHSNMRIAISAATSERCLGGRRLLDPERGERYVLRAHGRDAQGNLLASVTVYLPWSGAPYVRRVRLIRDPKIDATLHVEVARDSRQSHT